MPDVTLPGWLLWFALVAALPWCVVAYAAATNGPYQDGLRIALSALFALAWTAGVLLTGGLLWLIA